jgi:LDH2 family malate/lactate/ureidoglycolate dehydrogenase
VVLDMALTASGRGSIAWAFREGAEIPDTWALTADGRRSTDPADYLSPDGAEFHGTQLPIGDFKGYGLSLFTDVLAGVLSGAKFGLTVFTNLANHDVGHFLMAIDPEVFMPRDEFQTRLEQLLGEIKAAEPIQPDGEILLPGELELRRERECERAGIPIDEQTVARLRELSAELGVACPL